jgi:hypothetical protein
MVRVAKMLGLLRMAAMVEWHIFESLEFLTSLRLSR